MQTCLGGLGSGAGEWRRGEGRPSESTAVPGRGRRRKPSFQPPAPRARREATSLAGCVPEPPRPLAWATEGQPHPAFPSPSPCPSRAHARGTEPARRGERQARRALRPPPPSAPEPRWTREGRSGRDHWKRSGGGTRQERGAGPPNLFQISPCCLKPCVGRNPVIKVERRDFFLERGGACVGGRRVGGLPRPARRAQTGAGSCAGRAGESRRPLGGSAASPPPARAGVVRSEFPGVRGGRVPGGGEWWRRRAAPASASAVASAAAESRQPRVLG